jgi:hypothetical protein
VPSRLLALLRRVCVIWAKYAPGAAGWFYCRPAAAFPGRSRIMAKPTAFRLSRIHAEGWAAGRKLPPADALQSEEIAALNPYTAEPERTRWRDGFVGARG